MAQLGRQKKRDARAARSWLQGKLFVALLIARSNRDVTFQTSAYGARSGIHLHETAPGVYAAGIAGQARKDSFIFS